MSIDGNLGFRSQTMRLLNVQQWASSWTLGSKDETPYELCELCQLPDFRRDMKVSKQVQKFNCLCFIISNVRYVDFCPIAWKLIVATTAAFDLNRLISDQVVVCQRPEFCSVVILSVLSKPEQLTRVCLTSRKLLLVLCTITKRRENISVNAVRATLCGETPRNWVSGWDLSRHCFMTNGLELCQPRWS